MTAPAGAIVRIYLDTARRVDAGDVVETQTGRRYGVLVVRVQLRGKHRGRQHLSCQVLTPGDGRSSICDGCILAAMHALVAYKPPPEPPPPQVIPQELAEQRFVRSHDVDRHGGLVYAVATIPDLDIRRIKVGYTTRPIALRLDAFRTVNPTVSLLGLWAAPSDGEDIAHRTIDGRLRNTEVFHVPDVVAALSAIDEELRRRWP